MSDGDEDRRADRQVEMGWARRAIEKMVATRPERRADREVEVLVDDDEGHADRHDAEAGGVAQDGGDRVAGAEEAGIDVDAGAGRAAP